MVTLAHTAPDCAEIMWNEQNWTFVAMPVTSTKAQWDEGLRTVRQFNDLLRVLPPVPDETSQEAGTPEGQRTAWPSHPVASAGRAELQSRRAGQDVAELRGPDVQAEAVRRDEGHPPSFRRPPTAGRNGHQAANYQR